MSSNQDDYAMSESCPASRTQAAAVDRAQREASTSLIGLKLSGSHWNARWTEQYQIEPPALPLVQDQWV